MFYDIVMNGCTRRKRKERVDRGFNTRLPNSRRVRCHYGVRPGNGENHRLQETEERPVTLQSTRAPNNLLVSTKGGTRIEAGSSSRRYRVVGMSPYRSSAKGVIE